jgi:hypothetical protein
MLHHRFACLIAAFALANSIGCSDETPGPLPGTPVEEDPGPAPFITEFLTKNQAGIVDEDGETSDWIEIYNPHTAPREVGGYHLTDSKSKPDRWTFPPETIIPPNGYLVVFASGKNRLETGKPLHTDFSLSSGTLASSCSAGGGDYLALTNKEGSVLGPEWNPYPGQISNVSFGLLESKIEARSAHFAKPTPGAQNDATSALAEGVSFGPKSRTFNSGTTLNVTLSVTSPTAQIRYTTNRSRPISVNGKLGNFVADATTDNCVMTGHGFTENELVHASGPAPLVAGMNYFVKVVDTNTFKFAIEPGGTPIDLAAGGTFEVRREATTGTAALTDVITTPNPHFFFSGDAVQAQSSGTLPTGLSAATTYYVSVTANNTFTLSTSPTLTPTVDITSVGTGTLTIYRLPSPVYSAPIPVTKNTRIRTRAYEPGRPDGPLSSEMYFALDVAAQTFSSTLPLVLSHTWNTVMANNMAVDGFVMIFEPKSSDNQARLTNVPDLVSPCTLERHGSSTGGDPKFSMAVELQDEDGIDQECSPFGMPKNADWLMHAPYYFDKSMMHNDLIYRLSNEAGRYAARTKYIEHIHNEQSLPDTIEGAVTGTDYFGVYSFMEKISRGKDRVNVENLTIFDTTLPTIQGGYMFKVDRLDTGELGIQPLSGQSFGGVNTLAWVNPRELSSDPFKVVNRNQSDFLRGYLGSAWLALSSPTYTDPVNGYAKYFDVSAAVDHHIMNVATKNADAFRLSSHWHKPRSGKLVAGPVWDFDRAEGSTDGRDFDWGTWTASGGTDFFNYPWYKQMLSDPNFWQVWIDRLEELRQGTFSTARILSLIDDYANTLDPGDAANTPAKRSISRWAISAPRPTTSNTAITNNSFNGQYTGEVAWLKYWWTKRLAFMDSQVTRPAVANPPQGAVATGTTVTLASPSQSLPGAKMYYTTDGSDPRGKTPGPLLSPNAKEYTGPIPITAATRLFVRVYNPTPTAPVGSGFSAPTILSYTLK